MLFQSQKETLQITDLTTPNLNNKNREKLGEDIIQGLSNKPKTLPPKYFYDDRGSELFEEICQLSEYYPTRTETAILSQYAEEIAQITGACELVELGSGSSTKTHLLLEAYLKIIGTCKYVPIDVSKGMLTTTAFKLQEKYPSLAIQGLIGTYEQALENLKPTAFPARMIFFLGSSIGNFNSFERDQFFNQITSVLKDGDYFLLGVDLQKSKAILEAAYNDSQGITAAFNLNMLSHLNWRFQGDINRDLFTHKAIYNQAKNQIEMYLICQKKQVFYLKNLDLLVSLEAEESILTEISCKFDLEQLKKELESKKIQTLKTFTDEQNWFGLLLCQKVNIC